MTIRKWLIAAYVVASLYFLLDPLTAGWSRSTIFSSGVSLLMMGYCGMWAVLLARSKHNNAVVMTVAGITIFLTYVQRIVVLTLDATRLAEPPGVRFTSADVYRTVAFMFVITIAFWIGTRIGLRHGAKGRDDEHGSVDYVVYIHRRMFMTVALLSVVTAAVLSISGVISRTQDESTGFSVVSRVLPIYSFAYLLAHMALKRWSELTLGYRVALFSFGGLLIVGDLAIGKRSSIFGPLLVVVVTYLWADVHHRLKARHALAGAGVMLVALPILYNAVLTIRDSSREGRDRLEALTDQDIRSGLSLWEIGETLTDRLASFDETLAVLNYQPRGVKEKMTGLGLAESTFQGLAPNSLWSTDQPRLGSLYAYYYQGLPTTVKHQGAWSGPGIAYAYFGWWAVAVFTVYGFGLVVLLRRCQRSRLVAGGLAAYTISVFVFETITSGNVDTIVSNFLPQFCVAIVVLSALSAMSSSSAAQALGKSRHRVETL